MIRKTSACVGCWLLMGVLSPSAGCGSSERAAVEGASSAGASSSMAGAAGIRSDSSAGAATLAGAAGSGASPNSAGSSGAPNPPGVASGAGGASAGNGDSASGDSECDAPGLVWKSANKTNYTSYPAPGSDECLKFSGCEYEGLFAACEEKQTLDWVKAHNIVAAFPLNNLELHDLCLKSGSKTIVVTVYDTCGDDDCDGCCTQNKGDKDELIDVESFTDQRWGVDDGAIEWADLGPTKSDACVE
jgi:hypothetical protein